MNRNGRTLCGGNLSCKGREKQLKENVNRSDKKPNKYEGLRF